jgi:anti-sigma-K factor RskA
VTGCPTHGPLVGGYVLGALEHGEMEEMRAHLAACPQCGPEADRLAALPGLLDRIVPADVPPPALSPAVEEAVLDRFARERRGRRARPAWAPPARLRPALPVAAAALVALLVALAVLLPSDGGDEGSSAYANVRLSGPAGAAASADLAQVPAGTRIRLTTTGLPARTEYELWCVRGDGRWVSGGTFWADADGSTDADLTAAVKPGDYHWMAVTKQGRERDSRGAVVLRGELRY